MPVPPSPLSPHRFRFADTDDVREGKFARWRRMIGPAFDIAAEPDEIGLFDGDLAGWLTDRFLLSALKVTSISLIRASQANDNLEHFALTLVLSGSWAGIAGNSEVDAKEGDVFFRDLAQTIRLRSSIRGGVTEEVTLWVPRIRLLASVADENALHGLTLKGTSPAGAVIAASLRALSAHATQMTSVEFDALADGVIECAARAAAPALQALASSGFAPLASFVTIRRYIDRNLTSLKLDADSIAKSFGLSRASLYRLFEPVGGIAGYIRRQRLNRAYQEITAAALSNRRISLIAHQSGFKNVGSFNRAFREAYGISPGEARAAALRRFPGEVLRSGPAKAISLSRWLAQIGPAK